MKTECECGANEFEFYPLGDGKADLKCRVCERLIEISGVTVKDVRFSDDLGPYVIVSPANAEHTQFKFSTEHEE